MVEKSPSVDNLFVFVIIVSTFAVPAEVLPRAVDGDRGPLPAPAPRSPLRGILIAAGTTPLATFSFMPLISSG